MHAPRAALATELMAGFADRTGLTGQGAQRRYLWTDAFAVRNYLASNNEPLASALVDRVHHVLGRFRPGDVRQGWISGLPEEVGEAHPTLGGLRIGKPQPEREPDDVFDEELEWERDGQYFHYLTKWMGALDRLARAKRARQLNVWARELADTAHRRFTHDTPGGRRMYWKMSVDLTRPLVPSMGHHDPLDGLVTCLRLQATATELGGEKDGPDLRMPIRQLAEMIDVRGLATADPLGLGGLLEDVVCIAQLGEQGPKTGDLFAAMIDAAAVGLHHYAVRSERRQSANRRLAFRELGLAIGLGGLANLGRSTALDRFIPLRDDLESFWIRPEHRSAALYLEHRDINDVMLATCLLQSG